MINDDDDDNSDDIYDGDCGADGSDDLQRYGKTKEKNPIWSITSRLSKLITILSHKSISKCYTTGINVGASSPPRKYQLSTRMGGHWLLDRQAVKVQLDSKVFSWVMESKLGSK
ncbi:hypothetical protein PoB_000281400 [Plakobranchus ocellatus]|uniref:Uncharacterized protein n=1 Tax=Plakobranchus ocellatus TaxID=259542 RepID=A0AAV3Y222_9GAST|nr:hypothetical protein PoB_000281400 [Plakobranchus ocellatus]